MYRIFSGSQLDHTLGSLRDEKMSKLLLWTTSRENRQQKKKKKGIAQEMFKVLREM